MSQDDESSIQTLIQTLAGLGLTFLQARLYLTLANLGKADVKTISKASDLARPEIYRIMTPLQKMGLAEKILAKPNMYKATPLKEGMLILLQNRKKEYVEIQKKTNRALNNFHQNISPVPQEEDSQFIITSEITRLYKARIDLIRKTEISIDMVLPLSAVERNLFRDSQYYKWAMKRGVKIRLVTQIAEGESTPRKPKALTEDPFFEIKYLTDSATFFTDSGSIFGMHIFDKKQLTLCVSEKGGVPSLWSNNPHVIKLAANYFETLWKEAPESLNR